MVAPTFPPDAAADSALATRLRSAGLRATQARVHTLAALSTVREPMSHDALAHHLAQALGPGVLDRTTVYRNLVDLTRVGLVRREHGVDRTFRYRLMGTIDQHKRAHPHFSCNACGVTQCLPATTVRLQEAAETLGNLPSGIEVTLSGQCGRCSPSAMA